MVGHWYIPLFIKAQWGGGPGAPFSIPVQPPRAVLDDDELLLLVCAALQVIAAA